jgi:hypothetical protein
LNTELNTELNTCLNERNDKTSWVEREWDPQLELARELELELEWERERQQKQKLEWMPLCEPKRELVQMNWSMNQSGKFRMIRSFSWSVSWSRSISSQRTGVVAHSWSWSAAAGRIMSKSK